MKRFHVIVSVPVEDDEQSPRQWNWQALLDTPHHVEVLDQTEVDLLPGEGEEED